MGRSTDMGYATGAVLHVGRTAARRAWGTLLADERTLLATPEPVDVIQLAAPAVVPQQRQTPEEAAGPAQDEGPSPAYAALAQLGRTDARLALSAADCMVLEPLAAQWFARGVDADYVVQALVAGLPSRVDSPVGFVRRRLTDKIRPRYLLPPYRRRPATPYTG